MYDGRGGILLVSAELTAALGNLLAMSILQSHAEVDLKVLWFNDPSMCF